MYLFIFRMLINLTFCMYVGSSLSDDFQNLSLTGMYTMCIDVSINTQFENRLANENKNYCVIDFL